MKRSLVVLALVTVAGTAVAQTATTPPLYSPSPRGNAVTPAAPAAPSTNTPAPSSQTQMGQTQMGTGQSQMGTGGMPATNPPGSPAAPSMAAPSTANAPAMPNAPGSANALKKIEADGYKNVSGLTRNPDGSWSGKAMRGGSMVDVMVDARGNVSTR
jgi:hypothetical protein